MAFIDHIVLQDFLYKAIVVLLIFHSHAAGACKFSCPCFTLQVQQATAGLIELPGIPVLPEDTLE